MVVVHHDGTRFRLLVLRNFDRWDFPKRRVAADGDALQSALEELEKTTGIVDPALPWGEDYRETVPYDNGQISRYYLAQARDMDVTLRLSPGEGADDFGHRWVTVEEAEDLLPPRLALVLDWVVARLASGPLPA